MNRIVFRLGLSLAPGLAGAYLRLVEKTSRVEAPTPELRDQIRERYGGAIFAVWHSRLLYPAYHYRNLGLQTIISRSRDGEIVARAATGWGYDVVRGSTARRGAEAFRGLLRRLNEGRDVVITPDGPRGPREQVQPGIIVLSRMTGYPIVPLSYDASRRVLLRSWDRFLVPLPFSHIQIVVGEPIGYGGNEEAMRQEVETALRRASLAAAAATRGVEE